SPASSRCSGCCMRFPPSCVCPRGIGSLSSRPRVARGRRACRWLPERSHCMKRRRLTPTFFFKLRAAGSALCVAGALAVLPHAGAQAQPVGLPSMGVASAAELSPGLERTLGDAIMEQGRRDPAYIADPDVLQYLTDMGRSLVSHADTSVERINVFAL